MPVRRFIGWVKKIFGRKKKFRLAVYGLPNAGKTSLANRISLEWTGKELGSVSEIPHETRYVKRIHEVKILSQGKEIILDLFDVPGISYSKDLYGKHYQEFLKRMPGEEAKQRVREAIGGVKTAVKLMDEIDCALLLLDSTENPFNPVNSIILGSLASKKVPALIVANKTDLPDADPLLIKKIYSDYPVVEVSALKDENIDPLYRAIAEHHRL